MPELSDFELFLQQLDKNKQNCDSTSNPNNRTIPLFSHSNDPFPIQQPIQAPSLDSLLDFNNSFLPPLNHPPTLDSFNWIPEQQRQQQQQQQHQLPPLQPLPPQQSLSAPKYGPEIKIEDTDDSIDSNNIPLPQQLSSRVISLLPPDDSLNTSYLNIKTARARRHSRSNSRSSSCSSSSPTLYPSLSRSSTISNNSFLSPNSDNCPSSDFNSEIDDDDDDDDDDNDDDNDENDAQLICQTCGKQFNRPYNLKSHLKSHTNDKPYPCKICGKLFARQHDCKRHEDLHTGERKYQCRGTTSNPLIQWGCLKKFARTDALRRHFWTENGKNCIKPLLNDYNRDFSNDYDSAVEIAMKNAIDLIKLLNPSIRKPRERKSHK